jgi:hypothetical protein
MRFIRQSFRRRYFSDISFFVCFTSLGQESVKRV